LKASRIFRFLPLQLLFFALWLGVLSPTQTGCTQQRYTVKVHKPKQRCAPYRHQKDRYKQRLKTVRMKN
jgi:hypothetical protein